MYSQYSNPPPAAPPASAAAAAPPLPTALVPVVEENHDWSW
jgi:hypothetical protein